MKLGVQLYPHNNKRYFESMKQLAIKEYTVLLQGVFKEVQFTYETVGGIELLTFEIDTLTDDALSIIRRHSSLLALYGIEGNSLIPMMAGDRHYFNDDIAYILKYKGKTNEMFSNLMLNIGIFSSDYAKNHDEPLHVLDVMCGKATSMFIALKHGYNSAGIELNKSYYSEVENFIKRYFKFNKLKHNLTKTSYDVPNRKRALKFTLETADTAEHYKASETRSLQFVLGDTRYAPTYFGKKKFHTILADLPYGVQHQMPEANVKRSNKKSPIEDSHPDVNILKTIDESVDGWISTLKPGGTIVLSYNSNTMQTVTLKSIMLERGLTVLDAGIYSGFGHWVEQSITREIMIIKK